MQLFNLMLCIVFVVLCTAADEEYHPFYPNENYGDFFHGDIFFRNGTFPKDRFATTRQSARWPNGVVPYIFDDIYSEEDKEIIRSAMAEFEKETCIKWVERTDEDFYVEILVENGCWSELGRVGGVQSLSLESPTCMKKGVILHEMMHALGFYHEHSRTDRDDYVTVVWDNIEEGMEPHFEKKFPVDIDLLGLGYDYHSVMHYGAWMFAEDITKPTLIPSDNQVPIRELGEGQHKGYLTALDIQKINKFYDCPAK
ncbi:hypothetical protein JTE90_013280 [Oedothorax gibbosus]|uniref:Metalloendopeptidase n=1 Tax=Oedothorax gibbosus TaxID=931172 RepID=A0AAV6VD02_9ARAC|nr:hypothetical protein JTE90_013280 [Oedothorax gibbosus]